ncbi:hypothetical protein BDV97DRAFT_353685 [Delphinella strobiligena]|nr:hypothetical protein BDV97DRAFT_353685 [Delphinella strobiligena]
MPPKAINPLRLIVPNSTHSTSFRSFAKAVLSMNKSQLSLLTPESIIKAWDEATKHWLSHDSNARVHLFQQAYTPDNQTLLQNCLSRRTQLEASPKRTPLDVKMPEVRPAAYTRTHFEDFAKHLQNQNPGQELDQDEISAAFAKFIDLRFPTRLLCHRNVAENLKLLRREEKAYWKKRS